MYGHSYVPHQRMNKVYTPEIGLKMGTIFPELVSPYCPNQSLEVINYLKNSNTIGEGCNS
ncbi:MAG: spore coat associated protein CotJA [Clostridia bacterium]|nr:spore coat associated protein CotJA [Clostridia bacterium]